MSGADYRRLYLASDLVVTWDRYLFTVASTRWPPGLFVYDLAFLTVECTPRRGKVKVKIAGRGAHIAYEVLSFELDDAAFATFESLVADMVAHRDQLARQTGFPSL